MHYFIVLYNDLSLAEINWPNYPFRDECQTALFKDPVRTAL